MASQLQAVASALKSRNPEIRIAQYTAMNEVLCYPSTTQDQYDIATEVSRNNWWLRTADGKRVQWTTEYNNCDINFSAYAPRNDKGQTFAQWKWQRDYGVWFGKSPDVDYVFVDNFWHLTRNDADWKRIKANLSAGSAEASAIMRRGYADYVNNIREATPRIKVVGNVNHDLDHAEYDNVLDAAFVEGLIGKSWSLETWAGWDSMMAVYRGALKRTRIAGNVFLNTFADPTDYRTIRYGLASALLEDGYHLHLPASGAFKPNWIDDYDAPLGDAAEAPPTAAAANGVWMRRYANGLVLVNPSKTASATIDVGAGYKRLAGTQDPAVNNGQAESVVTLGPREGLLMIRE
jgi:hypothetical protein